VVKLTGQVTNIYTRTVMSFSSALHPLPIVVADAYL
jgi:hypothetical protein